MPAVYLPLNLRHRSVFVIHRHRVTRDVETDISGESHAVPLRTAIRIAAFDEAVEDAFMPDVLTSAVTGSVTQDFGMARGECTAFAGLQPRAQFIPHRAEPLDLLIDALQLRFNTGPSFSGVMGICFQEMNEVGKFSQGKPHILHLLNEGDYGDRSGAIISIARLKALRRR
jgi:hypothetical protein